jgi:hypothetical protein
VEFELLQRFRALFEGQPYRHRSSTQGDVVAQYLFEDLVRLAHSPRLSQRIADAKSVLNVRNRAHGVRHRRGDGSFGTVIPGVEPIRDAGFEVARGPIANIEIGVELKVLFKALIKQIDRVKSDIRKQAGEFRLSDQSAITIAIVGINHAPICRSFEGDREFVTDGRLYSHPASEAGSAVAHIEQLRSSYDELLILPFRATNLDPFPFEWVNESETRRDYASLLVRVSNLYSQRH